MTAGPQWSHLAMEAALCVWEDLLERYDRFPTQNPGIVAQWKKNGTVHMRSLCPAIGSWIAEAFELFERDSLDGSAYDWEIVPAFVNLIDWEAQPNKPKLMAPLAAAKLVAERLGGLLACVSEG